MGDSSFISELPNELKFELILRSNLKIGSEIIYYGPHLHDQKHGIGTTYLKNCKMITDYKWGNPDLNNVTILRYNGSSYRGQVKIDGQKLVEHGFGRHTSTNGNTCEGIFVNGFLEGPGIITRGSSVRQEVSFIKGKAHGIGQGTTGHGNWVIAHAVHGKETHGTIILKKPKPGGYWGSLVKWDYIVNNGNESLARTRYFDTGIILHGLSKNSEVYTHKQVIIPMDDQYLVYSGQITCCEFKDYISMSYMSKSSVSRCFLGKLESGCFLF